MIFGIAKFIAGLFGLDISKVQRVVLIVVAAIVIVAVASLGLWLRSCFTKTPKIDQAAIEKINKANEKERKAELQKVIEDNADTVRTVDNRSALTEVNVVERNREIDARVKAADKAVQDAKTQGRDVTSEELGCILIPENCK